MRGQTLILMMVASLLMTVCGFAEVSDSAGVLSAGERQKLEGLVFAHNKIGPGTIRVMIVEKLPANTTVEAYAKQKINEPPPKPGEKLDRILLLVAIKDRELRIETSREVWGKLTDKRCQQIISQKIVPRFKEEKFFEGMEAGLKEIVKELKSEG